MAGPNLEVFKFGMYIMFPIAWMYYFGTNLENRFSVPDFWPKPESTYKIPFEKDEIQSELERLRERRLERRAQRLLASGERESDGTSVRERGEGVVDAVKRLEAEKDRNTAGSSGWWGATSSRGGS